MMVGVEDEHTGSTAPHAHPFVGARETRGADSLRQEGLKDGAVSQPSSVEDRSDWVGRSPCGWSEQVPENWSRS